MAAEAYDIVDSDGTAITDSNTDNVVYQDAPPDTGPATITSDSLTGRKYIHYL